MKKKPEFDFGDTVSFILNYRKDDQRCKGYYLYNNSRLYVVNSKIKPEDSYSYPCISTPKTTTYSTRMVLTEKTIDFANL